MYIMYKRRKGDPNPRWTMARNGFLGRWGVPDVLVAAALPTREAGASTGPLAPGCLGSGGARRAAGGV